MAHFNAIALFCVFLLNYIKADINKNPLFEHSLPELKLFANFNTTKDLNPAEFVYMEFAINVTSDAQPANNITFEVKLPFPDMTVVSADAVLRSINATDRISYDEQALNLSVSTLERSPVRVSILAKSSGSLQTQTKLPILYGIQYYLNASYQNFAFKQFIYSYSAKAYISQIIDAEPDVVEGGDRINASLRILNHKTDNTAFNLTLKFILNNGNIFNVKCTGGTLTQNNTEKFFLSITKLDANQSISCGINATASDNVTIDGKVLLSSTLHYYHKPQQDNFYPIQHYMSKHLNVSSINIVANSSKILSSLQAAEEFSLETVFAIPRSLSRINLFVKLPTYLKTNRVKRSTSSSTQDQPLLEFVQNKTATYTHGIAITVLGTPMMQAINKTFLDADFGWVKSLGSGGTNRTASSIRLHIWLRVTNDVLNVYGRTANIWVFAGNTNTKIPIKIIGPMVNPNLSIEKSVQILDNSRDSPLLQFTLFVKHISQSQVDAVNITISDLVDSFNVYTRQIKPQGTLTLAGIGTLLKITGFVTRLPVNQNITLVYTGSFSKGVQATQFKDKASISWHSAQINNAVTGRAFSQETCLQTSTKVITQDEKSYTMVLLGVVAGILFGILAGLLILFCMRRTGVGKTYIFLENVEERDDEEVSANGPKANGNSFRLDSIIGRQGKEKKKSVMQKLEGDKWALMIVASYASEDIAKAQSRTLIEELIRAYDNSFKYFVDSLNQVVTTFSTKLRATGDISAETLRRIQTGTTNITSTYVSKSRVIDHNLLVASDNLPEIVKQYLGNQCSLLHAARNESFDLFLSMIPKTFKEEKADEIKADFEDLQRVIFTHANSIPAETFLHVKSFQIMQAGCKNLLVWSKDVFSLWCKWISKKLFRELDILQRKRYISSEDTNILTTKVNEIFEQGELVYREDLRNKAVNLQRELAFDCWNFYKTLDNELQAELQSVSTDSSSGASKSANESMELIQKRCEVFLKKTKTYGAKTEENQQAMFSKALHTIEEVRDYQVKDIIGKIELLTIKYFSKTSASEKEEGKHKRSPTENSNGIEEPGVKEEAMRTILESLEDIQADFAEAQFSNKSSLENFLEEVEESRADIQNLVSSLLEQTEKLAEELILHCKFQFKSLLYFLRDLSLPKVKETLELWSDFLQLTLTELYVRNNLKDFSAIKASQDANSSEENEESVIFWFKTIDSITGNEFQKTKELFSKFVEDQKQQSRDLFNEQLECLKLIAKDYILKDLQEDSVYIHKISALKKEFLIVYQFLMKLLHELDDKQHLSDPEVKECFVKFEKATKSVISSDVTELLPDKEITKKEVTELIRSFEKDCDLLLPHQNVGVCAKVNELLLDEEGIVGKIMLMIRNRQKQDCQFQKLEKLHSENLALLASLRKIDKIPDSLIMMLVDVLHTNVSKERLDEIVKSVDGPSQRDYYADLIRYLVKEENADGKTDNEEPQVPVGKKTKKRKTGKKKKNAVVPEM